LDQRSQRRQASVQSPGHLPGLDDDGLRAVSRMGHPRRYHDGALIMLEGDTQTPVYFVLDGAVRVFRANLEGREQTLIYLRPVEALNLPGAFASHWSAPASAQAVGDAELLAISMADLRHAAQKDSALALTLLRVLAERVQHLSQTLYGLGLLSVRARLARFLLSEREAQREPPVRWTHAQIAARVGTVRVVVSRTLSAMASQGLIRLDRQRIEIVDPAALAREADFDLAPGETL
jgi:CRP-like cAMP-binding protein